MDSTVEEKKLVSVQPTGFCNQQKTALISIGITPTGYISIGIAPMGIIAIGIVPMGLISFGAVAMGTIATGAVSMGIAAFGVETMSLLSLERSKLGSIEIRSKPHNHNTYKGHDHSRTKESKSHIFEMNR
ncbi:hypothetical protein [Cyanobacterium sp. uoEpiScrs1]|uniref:hypothetical protein n=1 Tax=Cyanobacterium sp. uoEpiScrs1 TaxID=2976343 RepID=UPI00226A36AA|nr:hypothetical protein [Cyanobacterium sp. uoEpiScrs1]